jgi:dipeptidase E
MKNMFLMSRARQNSNQVWFEHVNDELVEFIGNGKKIMIITFAIVLPEVLKKRKASIGEFFERNFGNSLTLEWLDNPNAYRNHDALTEADCILVTGGNTYKLLSDLGRNDLIDVLKEKVEDGTKFIGYSAGSNIACPHIRATNDKNIINQREYDFTGLNSVPFLINPHYPAKNTSSRNSRQAELEELVLMNPRETVIGLEDGSYIAVEGEKITLKGTQGAVLFKKSLIQELDSGVDLTYIAA